MSLPSADRDETCLLAVSFVLPSEVPLCQIRLLWYGMGAEWIVVTASRSFLPARTSESAPLKTFDFSPVHRTFVLSRIKGLLFREMIMLIRSLLTFVFVFPAPWSWQPIRGPARGRQRPLRPREQGGGIRQDQQGVERVDRQPGGLEERVCHLDRRRQEGGNPQAVP